MHICHSHARLLALAHPPQSCETYSPSGPRAPASGTGQAVHIGQDDKGGSCHAHRQAPGKTPAPPASLPGQAPHPAQPCPAPGARGGPMQGSARSMTATTLEWPNGMLPRSVSPSGQHPPCSCSALPSACCARRRMQSSATSMTARPRPPASQIGDPIRTRPPAQPCPAPAAPGGACRAARPA